MEIRQRFSLAFTRRSSKGVFFYLEIVLEKREFQ